MPTFSRLRDAVAFLEAYVRDLEPGGYDADGAAELVDLLGRAERLCGAGKALAARRVDECGTWRREGFRSGAHWLAARSGTTVGDAEGSLRVARHLDELPTTEAAFRAGELSAVQAREIVETAALAPASEETLVAAATDASVKVLRDECRRVRASAVDDAAWAARQYASRRLDRWRDADGTGRGDWRLPADLAALVNRAIDDEADRLFRSEHHVRPGQPRAAYAADALVNLVTRGPRKPPEVKATFDVAAVDRGYVESGERCEIDGFGPIPVAMARSLLQDARVSLLVCDAEGVAVTATSPRPTIPRALRRQLEHRDRVCANHDCRGDGPFEIDHVVPLSHQGPTSLENCWRLCRHCHRLKTYFGWRVEPAGAGRHRLVPSAPRSRAGPRGSGGPDPP